MYYCHVCPQSSGLDFNKEYQGTVICNSNVVLIASQTAPWRCFHARVYDAGFKGSELKL